MEKIHLPSGKKRLFIAKWIGVIFPFIILFGLPLTWIGQRWELAWLDFLYQARQAQPTPENIVIVGIDDPSFEEIKLKWPWPVELHALLVEKLVEHGAKAIVFDVLFDQPSPKKESDETLAKALGDAGNVILGASISQSLGKNYYQSTIIEPLSLFAGQAKGIGMVNFFKDPDGVVRHFQENYFGRPGLAAETAKFINENKQGTSPFVPGDVPRLIDFIGPAGSIQTVSYYQALEPEKFLPKDYFKGKIVLIGHLSDTETELGGATDSFPTPFFDISGKLMAGVEIHANAVHTLLSGKEITQIRSPWLLISFLLICLAPWAFRNRPLLLIILVIGIVLGLMFLSAFLFIKKALIMQIVPVITAVVVTGFWWGTKSYVVTIWEKRHLREAFKRYVPQEVIGEILKDPSLLKLGGQRKVLSVLFSDIRGFTEMAEHLETPEKLVHLLSQYFNEMTKQIFNKQGTLDKYVGDAIIAIFGAPLPMPDHTTQACHAALGMAKALNELTPSLTAQGYPEFQIGIGINTGEMVVGNMGSDYLFDYTMFGDEVNLASRLEGLTKFYGVTIIIGEKTREAVKGVFCARELDLVRVKGKKKVVKVYELVCYKEPDGKTTRVLDLFSNGLKAYRGRDWAGAGAVFQEALDINPEDGPSKVFKKRCSAYLFNPPPMDWDGAYDMRTK